MTYEVAFPALAVLRIVTALMFSPGSWKADTILSAVSHGSEAAGRG